MRKIVMPVFIALSLLSGCSKEDDASGSTGGDTRLVTRTFSSQNGYIVSFIAANATLAKVVGIRFKVLKAGRLTKLGLLLPTAGTYTLTLWDVSGPTPTRVATETIQQPTNEVYADKAISPISIIPSKTYVLSVFLRAPFYFSAKTGVNNVFPITAANVSLLSAQHITAGTGLTVTETTYPDQVIQTGAWGFTDFEFKAD
jgi:hypothetical protein